MKQAFSILIGIAVVLFVALVIKNWEKIFPSNSIQDNKNNTASAINTLLSSMNKNTTCELKDANGNTIKITGSSDDPQFQSMCSLEDNSPVYVYGFPYYYSRGGRHHRGGGHH